MTRYAKIIATIGPASQSEETLRALILAGMSVVRLNFSHGTHEEHEAVVTRVRKLSQELDRPISILQDLRGPKLRTGDLKDRAPLLLEEGGLLLLTTDTKDPDPEAIPVNYAKLPSDVNIGDRILVDDGRIELLVTDKTDVRVQTSIIVGGELKSHKGINLPNVRLSIAALTEKDIADLRFGLSIGVDAVALSFVRSGQDLLLLREKIERFAPERKHLPIIAKLELPEAVENLEEILDSCNGVMVARGDLGVEMSPEKVPSIQKHIIQRANARLRTVITATQMLESMIQSPRPTRAEASDVANAVFDGSDLLMLSGETAIGAYPVEAVQTMARIIEDAESHATQWGLKPDAYFSYTDDDALATANAARGLAHDRDVAALAVFTMSGRSARLASKVRPEVPILAFTPSTETYTRLNLYWGVIPNFIVKANSVEDMIHLVKAACLTSGLVKRGEQVVMVASLPIGKMGPPNFTYLLTID